MNAVQRWLKRTGSLDGAETMLAISLASVVKTLGFGMMPARDESK